MGSYRQEFMVHSQQISLAVVNFSRVSNLESSYLNNFLSRRFSASIVAPTVRIIYYFLFDHVMHVRLRYYSYVLRHFVSLTVFEFHQSIHVIN